MLRTLLFFFLLIQTVVASAAWDRSYDPERIARSRHYILRPANVLGSAEVSELAARGIEVRQPLSEGRYLVRVAPGTTVDATFEPLSAEKKIDRRVLRAAAAARPFVNANVLFHDDVPFEAARNVIAEAGGALTDPLQLGFEIPTRIRVRIPTTALLALAADERVLLVTGARKLKAAADNATTARLSGVDLVQQSPYNLTGAGVTLSFFEFAPADVTHREFEGRLTTHLTGTDTSNIEHATHVAGTMIAAGIDAAAKGMAPRATLHQFHAGNNDFLSKKENLPTFSVTADNNSWGYVLGWCTAPSCEGWVWDDTEEFYGAYDVTYTAPLDRISRTTNVLMVHSAGNDAEKRGPRTAPFAHQHTDEEGELITGTFCYSQNGTGTDCPAAPACSAGPQFCERERHPEIIAELPAPFGSVGLTASAKNVVAVGAVDLNKSIAIFSSRGPARDGRVKPEIVARGVSVYSARPGNLYRNQSGTSMSAPAVTGMAALLTEQWRRTFGGADPSAAVLKTLLIAGAEDLGNDGPDYTYGFGLANLKSSVDLVLADAALGRRIKTAPIDQGASFETTLNAGAGQNVRVVLGWADPEVIIFPSDGLATKTLVNDLDLRVITPSGQTMLPFVLDPARPTFEAVAGVNTVDNTEVVEIRNAGAGTYRVVVAGTRITAQAPQQFVLIANADMEASAAPCVEIGEPNENEATAMTLAPRVNVAGKTCAAGDVDFFRLFVNQPGTIAVNVAATDTAVRVSLTSSGTAPVNEDVPAGQSRVLTLGHNTTAGTTYFVRIEAIGPIGGNASYTISADYPFDPGTRRRAVRR